MWEKLTNFLMAVVTLSDELKENREEIKEIRQELRDRTAVVQRLAADAATSKEREATERELLLQRVSNALLLFERRLPPPKP